MKTNQPLTQTVIKSRGSIVQIFTDINIWTGIRKVIEQINANAVA